MSFSLFPALFDHPDKIRFAEQELDEHVELLLRQHWITNVPWIFFSLLALGSPPLILLFSPDLNTGISFPVPLEIKIAALVIWYMLIAAFIIEKILFWYFNIYIVTNIHIVDIVLHNLMSRHVTEIRLEDVQSARSHVRGITGPLFNYGDVIIKTAADKQDIEFLLIPRPDFVADRISDLQEGRTNAS